MRVTAEHLDQVLHPQFSGKDLTIIATGLAASPGAAVGRAYFTADDAADAADRGEKVVLVRSETSPEDVHGMQVSEGILTARGGLVSHAAVVARGWGIPAVVGAEAVKIAGKSFTANGFTVNEGDVISLDGTTGQVILGEVALTAGEPPKEFNTILTWADQIRKGKLKVRANADNGPDAANARQFGAEGIGLCRTEHMFLGEDRLPVVRRMILANTPDEETAALEELRVVQKADFEEILEAMDGLPVTVRLLDPPLHEFLPDLTDLSVRVALAQERGNPDPAEVRLLDEVRRRSEQNPMLGLRGVRLGLLIPGLVRMQVRAIAQAATDQRGRGVQVHPEIMVPLVGTAQELHTMRDEVEAVLATEAPDLHVPIGTMIELPRAALTAGQIAAHADFFSFGTNDLTQTTWGFSRDDVEASFFTTYLERGIFGVSPFESIDPDGVGRLVRIAVVEGRGSRPGIKLGVCGEHGGDPASVRFFHDSGLDYVSCSVFRVPIARLEAGRATVLEGPVASSDRPT
jgi:pyruvate,orthophosphate dikinase